MTKLFKRLRGNEQGATAVEFALYSTAFFSMLIGGVYASLLGYTSATLQAATESAARCRALAVTCTDATTTQNYAISKFHNLTSVTPAFVSSTDTCGNKVTGSITYNLNYIYGTKAIALTSAACFPSQTTTT